MFHKDAPERARRIHGRASWRRSTRTKSVSATAAGWIKIGLSSSILTLAPIFGLQLGMSGPAVSPVSPAAITGSQPGASSASLPGLPLTDVRPQPMMHVRTRE